MKKLLVLLLAVSAIVTATAQPQIAEVEKIWVYGVDFSLAKLNAVGEADQVMLKAYDGINKLLLTEPAKYDFGKAFLKPIAKVDILPTQVNNLSCDLSQMRTDAMQTATVEQIAKLISGYELEQKEGTGVVVVALLLDKSSARATHNVIFFDIATRDIIFNREVTTKAAGFGLRNFWASTVYQVLKRWKVK